MPRRRYNEYRVKYKLPTFEALNREFGVSLSDKDRVLHDIIEKISERIFSCARILEHMVFVNSGTNFATLYERNVLMERRDDSFELFKMLMSLGWSGRKADVSGNERQMCMFINDSFNKWSNNLKHRFLKICDVLETQWKTAEMNERRTPEGNYHG